MRLLTAVLLLLLAATVRAEEDPMVRQPDAYQDSTGWAVAKVKPAADLIRWGKFEDAVARCEPCMKMSREEGLFKAYHRFRMEGVYHYWAILLDIPTDMTLIFDQHSSVVMLTEDGEVRSTNIVFPVGWDPMPQHALRETSQGPVYVYGPAFGDGPSSKDYEWARLRSEWDDLPNYYVVGYAWFEGSPEPTGWRVDNVTPIRR